MAGGFRRRLIVNSLSICQQSLGMGLLALMLFSAGVCQSFPALSAPDTTEFHALPTDPSYSHASLTVDCNLTDSPYAK
ncbi:hypothetical protein PS858_01075 [Pseudomonas fluorescens]|jgi:hypothetical protein|nr:hypothetical protein PS858_01075 [Pseudomonas fluorescens]